MRTRRVLVAAVIFVWTWAIYTPPPADASGAAQYLVQCHQAVKVGTFDPIVFPGQSSVGHQHEFYANHSINPNSTYASLRQGTTECDLSGDTASYWAPTIFSSGARLPAQRLTAYYNTDNTEVEAWPANLKMIAGNKNATSPQPTSRVYWGCGNGSGTSKVNVPPQCGSNGELTLHVLFPDCWSGSSTDSTNHQSHMSYSDDGTCPASHPHLITQLTMRLEYDARPNPNGLTLSSGSVHSMHADIWNSWDPDRLERVTDYCIRGGRQCSADEAIAAQGPPSPK